MYEEYMQNLFGGNYYPYLDTYNNFSRNTNYSNPINPYDNFYNYEYFIPYNSTNTSIQSINSDLENLYPEIYKIIYPMVKKACNQLKRAIDEDLINELTEEIYSNIETDNIINLNINVDNSFNRKTSENHKENRTIENRQSSNPLLRDLIRILLIRELLGRPGNRPPFPPSPPPPNPPFPGPRPPMPSRPRPTREH